MPLSRNMRRNLAVMKRASRSRSGRFRDSWQMRAAAPAPARAAGLGYRAAMKISRALLSAATLLVLSASARAQRDPRSGSPFWTGSGSTTWTVFRRASTSCGRKGGGPGEHEEHQVYVLAYLEKNEKEILKLAKDPKLMTKGSKEQSKKKKKGKAEKKILDVLLERKLVTLLETTTSKRISSEKNKADPKTRRRTFAFPFSFRFVHKKLFEAVSSLPGFDKKGKSLGRGFTWYEQQFKLLVFIPANDSKYADKVSPKNKTHYDFAYMLDSTTIAQYFRPLPYVFQFKKIPEGEMLVYIH